MKKKDFKKLYVGMEILDRDSNEILEIKKCNDMHNIWAVSKGTFKKINKDGSYTVDGLSGLYCIDEDCKNYDGADLEIIESNKIPDKDYSIDNEIKKFFTWVIKEAKIDVIGVNAIEVRSLADDNFIPVLSMDQFIAYYNKVKNGNI